MARVNDDNVPSPSVTSSTTSTSSPMITLRGASRVRLGVSLHRISPLGAQPIKKLRLWVKLGEQAWAELSDDDDAAVVVCALDTAELPVTFIMKPRVQQGEPIKEARVLDANPGGSDAWTHAVDGLSAEIQLKLGAGTEDAKVEARFKVQVCDEDGTWWGKDPYIRVERVMYGAGTICS